MVARDDEGRLTLGGADLAAIVGEVGTPTYVYDLDGIVASARALEEAFDGAEHLVAFAVKANSAGPVVRALRAAGCGADVVSGAELALAQACGVAPDQILFSGVAKTDRELDAAALAGPRGVGAIQVESIEEVPRIAARARAVGRRVRISLRVNPESSLESLATHAHVATGHDEAKFGVPYGDVAEALTLVGSLPQLSLAGLSTHVGSQLTRTDAYVDAARRLFGIVGNLRDSAAGRELAFVDTGGGFGVDYGDGCPATPADFVRETRALQVAMGHGNLALHIEPGRALVAPHGVLVARVVQHKVTPPGGIPQARHRWLMIDAGMNDLIRPALYQARHRVVVVEADSPERPRVSWRIVGPVCESSDDFGAHMLSAEVPRLVALLDAGAYGYTMASRYNGRALPAEVFVRGGKVVAARPRDPDDVWVRDRAGASED